jgi:hypothetical protein
MMDGADLFDAEPIHRGGLLDRERHGVDVRQELERRWPGPATDVGLGLGASELPHAELQPLHFRRRDRFGPEEQPRQRYQGRAAIVVERADGVLGVGDQAGQSRVEGELELRERVRDVRLVMTGSPVARGRVERRVELPGAAREMAWHG